MWPLISSWVAWKNQFDTPSWTDKKNTNLLPLTSYMGCTWKQYDSIKKNPIAIRNRLPTKIPQKYVATTIGQNKKDYVHSHINIIDQLFMWEYFWYDGTRTEP